MALLVLFKGTNLINNCTYKNLNLDVFFNLMKMALLNSFNSVSALKKGKIVMFFHGTILKMNIYSVLFKYEIKNFIY